MKKIIGRKRKRELDFKRSTHLVLRLKENLPSLFCARDKKLREGFYKIAEKYSVKIYEMVFNHTHVHILVKLPSRESYRAFIREVTSRCVNYWSKKTGIKLRRVFVTLPFTRTIEWGRDFLGIKKYFEKNEKQSGELQLKIYSQLERQLSFLEFL